MDFLKPLLIQLLVIWFLSIIWHRCMFHPFCSYRKFGPLLVTNTMSTIDYYLDCIYHISACFPYCFPLMYPRLSHYLQILWLLLMTSGRVAEACLACLYYIAIDILIYMYIDKKLTLICQPSLQWAHSQFSLVDRNAGRYYVLNIQFVCHSHHSHNGRTSDIIQLQPL